MADGTTSSARPAAARGSFQGLRGELPNAPHVLREYSVISDRRRAAVIGPRGDIAWLCFPEFDSPTIFDTLVGGQGAYNIHPVEPFVWGGFYEDGTLIWRDRWVTAAGSIVECREALSFPGDPHRAVILRRLQGLRGSTAIRAYLCPRGDYGEGAFRSWRQHPEGCWTGSYRQLRARWSGVPAKAARPSRKPPGLLVEFQLDPGDEVDLMFEVSDQSLPEELPDADTHWGATEASWKSCIPSHGETAAPRDARMAYAVLLGLTRPGGGTAAAVTAGLPERADEARNYDYRYTWVRDQCLIGGADAAAGQSLELLDASVSFVVARALEDGPRLAPAYTTVGGTVPKERELDYPGYPGGHTVIGNHAAAQFQLDAFGECLVLLAEAAKHDRLDAQGWRAAEVLVDAIAKRWQEPDAGIWELEDRHWAHSKLACIAGLRAITSSGAPHAFVGAWSALADAILADTASKCIHPGGHWRRAPDDDRVDASLLLPPLDGALPADDPRTVLTYRAINDELTADGYVYRYRADERPLGEAEGAFQLCVFSLALAAEQQGDLLAAARWFERGRAACGPAGLFTEEFDVQERQLRGNLPQAFVHAMFLRAAAKLGPSERRAGSRHAG